MAKDVKEMTLDGLFSKLHGLMANLAKDIDSVLEDNRELGMDSVRQLRDHIKSRLSRNEEIEDNKKLLKLLNLFSEDKAVLEIIKEDSKEWVELLEAIEKSISERGPNLTKSEQNEIKEINRITSEIKSLIRKSD